MSGDKAELWVRNEGLANRVVASLNGDRLPDGSQLTVTLDKLMVDLHNPVVRKLIGIVGSSYDTQNKLLNLSSLHQRAALSGTKFHFNDAMSVSYLLCALRVRAKFAQGLLLDNNEIRSLRFFKDLHTSLPELKQLSLQNNALCMYLLFFFLTYVLTFFILFLLIY